jgi:hypothetical protein
MFSRLDQPLLARERAGEVDEAEAELLGEDGVERAGVMDAHRVGPLVLALDHLRGPVSRAAREKKVLGTLWLATKGDVAITRDTPVRGHHTQGR